MREYWIAVARRLGEAAFDVLFVAMISLAPLVLGRLVLVFGPRASEKLLGIPHERLARVQ